MLDLMKYVRFLGVGLCAFHTACLPLMMSEGDEGSSDGALLSLLALGGGATDSSEAPQVQYPSRVPSGLFNASPSSMQAPSIINGSYIPIGLVYDIEPHSDVADLPDGQAALFFGDGEAALLDYAYDPALLASHGLIEEFGVFYYSETTGQWHHVEKIEVDRESASVRAQTSHLTPFVLAAVAPSLDAIVPPPDCVSGDLPATLDGSGAAELMTVGPNYRYYKDRNYYIVENTDFQELGFDQALGISTCNGNSGCGPFNDHKRYDGTNYIEFTAHTDIDLYLMYDSRGGVTLSDDSRDAAWIKGDGFVNTGRFIQTTDAVQFYRVYKKSYSAGEAVVLHGNRRDVGSGGINTNYWLVMKPQGVTDPEPAHSLCVATPPPAPPVPVTGLVGTPGATSVALRWANPERGDFEDVVIRRSAIAPPLAITEGVPVSGSAPDAASYIDQGLSVDTNYHYTVFALFDGQTIYPAASVTVRTGADSDGDGLSDAFEATEIYPTGSKTDPGRKDTDNDGVEDGEEWAAGEDPTNPDRTAPIIDRLSYANTVLSRNATMTAHVDEKNYSAFSPEETQLAVYISQDDTRPRPDAAGWQWDAVTVIRKTFGFIDEYRIRAHNLLPDTAGTYTYYVFLQDPAGNVSAARQATIHLQANSPSYFSVFEAPDRISARNYVNPALVGSTFSVRAIIHDSEYSACGAPPIADRISGINYEVVSSPSGSTLTAPHQVESGANSSGVETKGYFVANVTGRYRFRISYDDVVPANCVGESMNVSSEIEVDVVRFETNTTVHQDVPIRSEHVPFLGYGWFTHTDGTLGDRLDSNHPPYPDSSWDAASVEYTGAEWGTIALYGCLGPSPAQCFPMCSRFGERQWAYDSCIQQIAPWAYAFLAYHPSHRVYRWTFTRYSQ